MGGTVSRIYSKEYRFKHFDIFCISATFTSNIRMYSPSHLSLSRSHKTQLCIKKEGSRNTRNQLFRLIISWIIWKEDDNLQTFRSCNRLYSLCSCPCRWVIRFSCGKAGHIKSVCWSNPAYIVTHSFPVDEMAADSFHLLSLPDLSHETPHVAHSLLTSNDCRHTFIIGTACEIKLFTKLLG